MYKKKFIFLSVLALASGQIFAATGVWFDNKSGITLEGKIDKFTGKEWIKVENGTKTFLPSGSGSRKIYWREFESEKETKFKTKTEYSTKDYYTLPDTIKIKDNGKKYDMTSGIAKKTVLDLEPNSITHKFSKSEKLSKRQEDIKKLETEVAELDKEINALKTEKKQPDKTSKTEEQKKLKLKLLESKLLFLKSQKFEKATTLLAAYIEENKEIINKNPSTEKLQKIKSLNAEIASLDNKLQEDADYKKRLRENNVWDLKQISKILDKIFEIIKKERELNKLLNDK